MDFGSRRRLIEISILLGLIACGAYFLRPSAEPAPEEASRQAAEAKVKAAIENGKEVAGAVFDGFLIGLTTAYSPKAQRERLLELELDRLDRALEEEPDNVWALYRRAHLLESVEDIERAMELDPAPPPQAYNNRAWYLAREGRFEEALSFARTAVEGDPEAASSWDTLGFIYVGLGRDEEAVSAYSSSLKLEPDHLYSLGGSAVALRRLGRAEEARARFARLAELAPDFCLHWSLPDDPGRHEPGRFSSY